MNEERRLAYRLALRLGYANPDAMRAIMPASVWRGWIEYAQLEPFGEDRADLRMAQLAAIMANAWMRKKGQRSFQIKDFLFDFDGELAKQRQKGQTPDELARIVMGLNMAFGGKFIDKRKEAA
jgi:hypothetical protein